MFSVSRNAILCQVFRSFQLFNIQIFNSPACRTGYPAVTKMQTQAEAEWLPQKNIFIYNHTKTGNYET